MCAYVAAAVIEHVRLHLNRVRCLWKVFQPIKTKVQSSTPPMLRQECAWSFRPSLGQPRPATAKHTEEGSSTPPTYPGQRPPTHQTQLRHQPRIGFHLPLGTAAGKVDVRLVPRRIYLLRIIHLLLRTAKRSRCKFLLPKAKHIDSRFDYQKLTMIHATMGIDIFLFYTNSAHGGEPLGGAQGDTSSCALESVLSQVYNNEQDPFRSGH